ncbi:MAG: restriction endonuclease subunit S [Nitrospira sp. BO4]|jgi:type I restriction enzyme S subunit|nr:restriction endonuclease subunit S [Nitrospira sp. BO4]
MAGEWRQCKVGDLFDLKPGFAFKSADFIDTGAPVIKIKNVKANAVVLDDLSYVDDEFLEKKKSYIVNYGDILITMSGNRFDGSRDTWVGKVAQFRSSEPYLLNQRVAILRPKTGTKLDHRCCSYILGSSEYQDLFIAIATSSGGQANLSPSQILSADVLLPPYEKQRVIAHILGTLDDKIELNRRMNETLEAMARALFKSWFVDFDPVRDKAEGRDPGLPKHIADLFPNSFEDSELGEIPRGWEVGRLDKVTDFLTGYAFKSKDWIEQGVPVIKIGSVKPGILDLRAVSYVSEEVAQKAARFRLSAGELLIGMTGYVGEVGLVPRTDNPPLLNQRVGKFLLEKPGTAALAYLYCLTRQPEFKAKVEIKSHGTAQANVSAEGILSIEVVVPPKTTRDEFNRVVQPILDRILETHAESASLAMIRDSLLPKLISGEIRINQAREYMSLGHKP